MNFVLPKTFLIGYSQIDLENLKEYLSYTDQQLFVDVCNEAKDNNLSDGEIMCSFYAKLCYKSLVLGKNANVSKIRDIQNNFESIIESKHGAVLEHFQLNFIVTNCSRIFTHEQVRHRVGTAYSQTSGRYVALDNIDLILDPILNDIKEDVKECIEFIEKKVKIIREKLGVENKSFEEKKRLTSAIRRLAPNGQSNEIGISLNLRSLRNIIQLRTSRHAEWEIRLIYNQIAEIIINKWPHILYGYSRTLYNDLYEYTNLQV